MRITTLYIVLTFFLISVVKLNDDVENTQEIQEIAAKGEENARKHEEGKKSGHSSDTGNDAQKHTKHKKQKNFIEWLFFPEEKDKDTPTCNPEFIHSYHLYLITDREENHKNFLCPYIKKDCCSFQSQKMIQALWKRISEPRLQRVLTRNLFHVESIITSMKQVIELFTQTKLPAHAKYSAECLESIQELTEYVDQGVVEKFNLMFMLIKKGFNNLYKFKKQFYCAICDQDNVENIDLGNKLIFFSEEFCTSLSKDYKDISWFLNYELKNYFTTIRNYVLCYRDKNYLLAKNLYEFRNNHDMITTMAKCRDAQDCRSYCEGYSFTTLQEMFIGQYEQLAAMKEFLDLNKPDNRGFFDKQEILNEDEELQHAKDNEEADRNDERYNKAVEAATGGNTNGGVKKDFYKDGKAVEAVQWDFFKKSFDMHKQRMIRKKMAIIRAKIETEFQPINLKENFLTVKDAKHNLINFLTKIGPKGMNPYDRLDKENIYVVNANLTFFNIDISNTVNELLNLNETDTLKKMVNVTKLMGDDKVATDNMQKYVESKIFKNMTESKFSMVENPYIDIKDSQSIWKSIFKVLGGVVVFIFSF